MDQSAEIKMLLEALQNIMGCYDTPVSRRRYPPDEFMNEALKEAREVLDYFKVKS